MIDAPYKLEPSTLKTYPRRLSTDTKLEIGIDTSEAEGHGPNLEKEMMDVIRAEIMKSLETECPPWVSVVISLSKNYNAWWYCLGFVVFVMLGRLAIVGPHGGTPNFYGGTGDIFNWLGILAIFTAGMGLISKMVYQIAMKISFRAWEKTRNQE